MQFSLKRLFELILIAGVICGLFTAYSWPIAFFLLAGLNGLVAWIASFRQHNFLTNLALLTALLIFMALLRTDWRVSMPNGGPPRPSWTFFTAATITQLVAVGAWFFRPGNTQSSGGAMDHFPT